MRNYFKNFSIVALMFLLMIMMICGSTVNAGSISDKDFSLRFPAALNHFSSYADVAAVGGASAGSKWQSSSNPASSNWQPIPGEYHLSLNPQYSMIVFGEGAVLHVVSESITKNLDTFGTAQFTAAQVRSNESTTRQDLNFFYDMNYFQIQWGKKFSDDVALGCNFSYSSGEAINKIGSATIAAAQSETYSFRLGILSHLAQNLLAGAAMDYSWSPSTTTMHDAFGMGTGKVHVRDRTQQLTLRLGPSYEYKKDSAVIVDYQFSYLENDMGALGIHRLSAGVDHRIADALFVRGGFALDHDGNTSWTGGLGIYPFKWFSMDLGYQYNMFPEVRPEFGRSHTATVSLGFTL